MGSPSEREWTFPLPLAVRNRVWERLVNAGLSVDTANWKQTVEVWSPVASAVAESIGNFLDNGGLQFAGISVQISDTWNMDLRLREMPKRQRLAVGRMLLEWADGDVIV